MSEPAATISVNSWSRVMEQSRILAMARITEREQIERDAWLLNFNVEEDQPEILPGQFTMVKAPGAGLLRRPYSYCDYDDSVGFTLFVKRVDDKTGALINLPVGGTVSTLGPLGRTFDIPEEDCTPVIVAEGTGIAPFILFCRLLNRASRRCIVLLGGRNCTDLYLRDTFEGFGMDVRVATEDGSAGYRGFVTDLILPALYDAGSARIYSCGPTVMMRRAVDIVSGYDIPHQVLIEQRMVCGMGCCLGCVVVAKPEGGGDPYYHRNCKEGPVFDAWRIQWGHDPQL